MTVNHYGKRKHGMKDVEHKIQCVFKMKRRACVHVCFLLFAARRASHINNFERHFVNQIIGLPYRQSPRPMQVDVSRIDNVQIMA